jgi:hypothetical protein
MRIRRFLIPWSAVRVPAFTVLALLAATRNTQAMCVDVTLQFREGQPAPTLVESMKEEASWIWAPYGVRIAWPTANGTQGCALPQVSFDVLDVLVDRQRSRSPKIVLGSTRLTPSPIRHAPIYIDYDATEQVLGSLSTERVLQLLGRQNPAPVDFGRALGRVLAHEIGHVILAAARHPRQGLMRASFTAEDLVRPQRRSFTLSEAEVARLRERELVLYDQASAPTRQSHTPN